MGTIKKFKPRDDWWTIKQVLTVNLSDKKRPLITDIKILGLGSDEKIYLYTSKGWVEIDGRD